MRRIEKIVFGLILTLFIVGLGMYVTFPSVQTMVASMVERVKSITEEPDGLAENIRREVFSSPLLGKDDSADAKLDNSGVISLTNAERANQGLPALSFNDRLANAAQTKLQDMFDRQYFEHISPDNHGPGYLADEAGYDYVVIGENLALGNFKDNAALVAAWMASPGHRENILNERFQEIGVAVGKGMYEGRSVWLAVQEFGKPLSECPRTDPVLRADIDLLRVRTDSLNADLAKRRRELDTMPKGTAEENATYNQQVNEYNAQVTAYEQISAELKTKIDKYNAQVRAFNACIKQ
jgi:uncharacterized protein YkwD